MKKTLFLFTLALILYTSYLDLTKGTLHVLEKSSPSPQHQALSDQIPYRSITVQPGDTVLTVLERLNGTLPVSLEEALDDFMDLNPGTDTFIIKAGKNYKFPLYRREN